ncbi:hypothetical protein IIC65_08210, partial [Candidatus Sumerlaeota bacterium]|nr:hypothetical protein [Candidatus Sumerlaeota bacterium]
MNSARWRRELPLVAAALFIAFSIWLIAKQNTQDSRTLKVPVRVVNIPPNVDLRYSPLQIPITVHFPQDQAIDVDVQHFEVVLDVQEMFGSDLQSWAGIEAKNAHKVRVTKDQVRTIALAPSVQVTSVGPPEEVTIEAELYTRWLQVHVPTTGELPPRYELDERGIRPDPDKILVTAPFEILQRLDQARIDTAPVDLNGR